MKTMKKIILISILLLSCCLFYGQGSSNLGFNQVLNYEYSVNHTNYNPVNVGTITVPTGKVWKITSGSASRIYGNEYYLSQVTIKVGEHIVSGYGPSGASYINFCPIWLGSGSYSVFLTSSSSVQSMKGALSVVEFNIE